jgi:hypothetical protein
VAELADAPGLKIHLKGVAQVVDGLGDPLVIPARKRGQPFSSLRFTLSTPTALSAQHWLIEEGCHSSAFDFPERTGIRSR